MKNIKFYFIMLIALLKIVYSDTKKIANLNQTKHLTKEFIIESFEKGKNNFFEEQINRTQLILQEKIDKKNFSNNNVHFYISFSNDETLKKAKNYVLLVKLLQKLLCSNQNLSGILANFIHKKDFDEATFINYESEALKKIINNQLLMTEKQKENLNQNNKEKSLKNQFEIAYKFYFINSYANNKSLNAEQIYIQNNKLFDVSFQSYPDTKKFSLQEFLDGDLKDTKFFFVDNCNKDEIEYFNAREYFNIRLQKIISTNRIIMVSMSSNHFQNEKIIEILEQLLNLNDDKNPNKIKLGLYFGNPILKQKQSDSTEENYNFYLKILNTKNLSTLFESEILNQYKQKKYWQIQKTKQDNYNVNFFYLDVKYEFKNLKMIYILKSQLLNSSESIYVYKYEIYDKENTKIFYFFVKENTLLMNFKYSTNNKNKHDIDFILKENKDVYFFLYNMLIDSERSINIYDDYLCSNTTYWKSCRDGFEMKFSDYFTNIQKSLTSLQKDYHVLIENNKVFLDISKNLGIKFETTALIKENLSLLHHNWIEYDENCFESLKLGFLRKPKIILKAKNLNNIPEYYQIKITTPIFGSDFNTNLININKVKKLKYENLVSFLKKNYLEKPLNVSSNIMEHKIDFDAPEIFLILQNINFERGFYHLYKCIFDKNFRNLFVGFYCKIFFIRQNFILKKYNDGLMILYEEIFKTKLNPLEFFNKNIIKKYNYESSKKTIMDMNNHPFFEIFELFEFQKKINIEFLDLLDDYYSNAADAICGLFLPDKNYFFDIAVSRESYFGRNENILSILNTLKVNST